MIRASRRCACDRPPIVPSASSPSAASSRASTRRTQSPGAGAGAGRRRGGLEQQAQQLGREVVQAPVLLVAHEPDHPRPAPSASPPQATTAPARSPSTFVSETSTASAGLVRRALQRSTYGSGASLPYTRRTKPALSVSAQTTCRSCSSRPAVSTSAIRCSSPSSSPPPHPATPRRAASAAATRLTAPRARAGGRAPRRRASGRDLREDVADHAVLVDEEGRALDAPVGLAVALLLDPGAITRRRRGPRRPGA